MHVQTNKCFVGIKAPSVPPIGKEKLAHELAFNVLLDYLFGKSSPHYERLYRLGLVDETFMYDYTEEREFGFAIVGGDTSDADRLSEEVKQILLSFSIDTVKMEELERVKKKKIGAFLRSLNSPEYIANQFTRYAFNGVSLFDVVPALQSLTMEQISEIAKQCFRESQIAVCQVVPKEKK
jgi:predicted Zn-dependent peptidase